MTQQLEQKGSFWRRLVGWILVVLGLTGIVLPIIPGIPLLAAGLVMLAPEHPWIRSWLVWVKRKSGKLWPKKLKLPRATRKRSSS